MIIFFFFQFFIRYFLHLHFKCYPKSPLYPLPTLLPYPPTPTWPWRSTVLGHIKFARPRGLSSQWWLTRPSSATYGTRNKVHGGLLASSCCWFSYRVADPFSSLGTFSSSSTGVPVIHPIADCEHPLLCLLGPGIVSQRQLYLCPFSKILLVYAMVSAFGSWLWDGSPGMAISSPSSCLSSKLSLCNSFHGCFVPISKKG